MSSNHFVPERGPDGKIMVAAPPAPEVDEQLPATDHQPPTTPNRPTFNQLFGQKATPKAPPMPWWAPYLAVALVALLGGTWLARSVQPPATSRDTPREVVTTVATALATAVPTPQSHLDRAVVAYAAPDGEVLGALEAGREYTPIARYGTSWAQLDVGEAAPVWVSLGDMPALTVAGLPDLAPKPTAIPPAVVEPVAPAVVVPCTEATASFYSSKRVAREGVPIGEVAAWSCLSQADAEAKVAEQEAVMLAGQ